jgi:hypothetical protein
VTIADRRHSQVGDHDDLGGRARVSAEDQLAQQLATIGCLDHLVELLAHRGAHQHLRAVIGDDQQTAHGAPTLNGFASTAAPQRRACWAVNTSSSSRSRLHIGSLLWKRS